MAYCYECGSPLKAERVEQDARDREICSNCSYVHYDSPTVLVGVFLFHQDKLFWIRRGIEPRKGCWSFPSGFLESDETVQEAAVRELYEETRIVRKPDDMIPFGILSLVPMKQIYLSFRCHSESMLEAQATEEATEWGWYTEEEAPWDNIANPQMADQAHETYRLLREGKFPLRVGDITERGIITKTYPLGD